MDAIGSSVANHYIFASADLALFKDLEAKVQSYQCFFPNNMVNGFTNHTRIALDTKLIAEALGTLGPINSA